VSNAGTSSQLLLWRHADAEEGLNDQARRLTQRGRKQAVRVARWLDAHLPGDYRMIVSPAVRAQQTATALARNFLTSPELAVGASPSAVLSAINWPECGGTTVVVGHQPTLGELAAQLVSGRNDSWNIRKGSVWWLRTRKSEPGVTIRMVIDPDLI